MLELELASYPPVSTMNISAETRSTESLMHYQPIPYKREVWPNMNKVCNLCNRGHQLAKDIFTTAVVEAINDLTIPATLSIDIKHQELPGGDFISEIYSGRSRWLLSGGC